MSEKLLTKLPLMLLLIFAVASYGDTFFYQCPFLHEQQTYSYDEQIDINGSAVDLKRDNPYAWTIYTNLSANKPSEPTFLQAASPYHDRHTDTWHFTCYPPNATNISAIKVVNKNYASCFVGDDLHIITCVKPTRPGNVIFF